MLTTRRSIENSETSKKSGVHDRLQDEFINIASHEMRTPVQSILTYSELLHAKPNESREEYVEGIYRNALRLQKLSRNLLDVTRIESQTLKLKNEKFDINELISCVIKDFVKHVENSGITRNVRLLHGPKGSIFIHADRDRIAQVISNLVDNAFKFTQKGDILVKANTQNDGNTVIVSVKDSGPGIDTQIIPRLFSKFTTLSEGGTGLGLYVTRSIVEAHGGKIWAQNNPNNVGTTFSFEIPSNTSVGS